MSIEAGWYADPTDAHQLRWWDGGQWTTHTQPTPAPAPQPEAAPIPTLEPLPPVVTTATPGLAPVTPMLIDTVTAPAEEPELALVGAGRVESTVTLADRAPGHVATAPTGTLTPSAAPAYIAPVRTSSPEDMDRFAPQTGGSRFGAAATTTTDAGWSSWDPAVNATAGASSGSGKRRIVLGVVALAVLAAVIYLTTAFVIPAFLNSRARAAAAEQPTVLVHSAPAKLAGRATARVPGFNPTAAATSARQLGAAWAWAGVYGNAARGYSLYVASDVPPDGVADAYRAQTDAGIARKIFSSANRGMVEASGGTVTLGGVVKYPTAGIGATWCAPLTISGRSAAYCLWTDGKEMLQMLRIPGDAPAAANEVDKALAQMQAALAKGAK